MSRSNNAPLERRLRGSSALRSITRAAVALLVATLIVVSSAALRAQSAEASTATAAASAPATRPAESGPRVIRLTLNPAPATRPALQYRLLPDPTQRTRGNAATVYLFSFLQALQVPQEGRQLTDADAARMGTPLPGSGDRLDYYLDVVPLERLPNPDVEQFLQKYQNALSQLEVAARRDHCDWDLPREQGFAILLPHLSPARDLAKLDLLQARLALARHDYPAAVHGMQTAISLGRDFGTKSLLVEALVGTGIASLSLEQVETLIQQPDAPNLYWPLADLPRPFVDVAASMREERTAMLVGLTGQAGMRRMKEGHFSAEDWEAFNARLAHITDSVGARRTLEAKLGPVAAAVVLYPAAKQYLVGRGVPAAEVDAMPVPAALARFYIESFEEWWDEMLKWTNLPFPEGYRGMRRAEDEIRRAETGFAPNPLLILMPSVSRAYLTCVELDRLVAALQTVEALRNFAATHDGRLPQSLGDITDTPVPADPTIGQPFFYKAEGNLVTLESPAPPNAAGPRDALRVEATFRK